MRRFLDPNRSRGTPRWRSYGAVPVDTGVVLDVDDASPPSRFGCPSRYRRGRRYRRRPTRAPVSIRPSPQTPMRPGKPALTTRARVSTPPPPLMPTSRITSRSSPSTAPPSSSGNRSAEAASRAAPDSRAETIAVARPGRSVWPGPSVGPSSPMPHALSPLRLRASARASSRCNGYSHGVISPSKVSPASPADYPDFVRLFSELGVPEGPPSAERFAEWIAPHALVLRDGDAVIGYAGCAPARGMFCMSPT
jgi:hypothetical protein